MLWTDTGDRQSDSKDDIGQAILAEMKSDSGALKSDFVVPPTCPPKSHGRKRKPGRAGAELSVALIGSLFSRAFFTIGQLKQPSELWTGNCEPVNWKWGMENEEYGP